MFRPDRNDHARMSRNQPRTAVARPAPTTPFKWLFAAAGLAAAIALAGALLLAGPAHASEYDGAWKVNIITQSGDCDPVYSYPVNITGGRVSYAGSGGFDISGNVANAGAVSVNIALGEQSAHASGKLAGQSGMGKWTGKSATAACSGRWEASRAGRGGQSPSISKDTL